MIYYDDTPPMGTSCVSTYGYKSSHMLSDATELGWRNETEHGKAKVLDAWSTVKHSKRDTCLWSNVKELYASDRIKRVWKCQTLGSRDEPFESDGQLSSKVVDPRTIIMFYHCWSGNMVVFRGGNYPITWGNFIFLCSLQLLLSYKHIYFVVDKTYEDNTYFVTLGYVGLEEGCWNLREHSRKV